VWQKLQWLLQTLLVLYIPQILGGFIGEGLFTKYWLYWLEKRRVQREVERELNNYKNPVLYAAGSLKAWTGMLRDVIAQVLGLYDEQERRKMLLREVREDKWDIIRGRIERLFEHKIWTDSSPEVDNNLRVNNESHVREFFKERELTVNWILGGSGA